MIFNSELIEGNVSISLSPENELEKRMVKNYNIVEINIALYEFDQILLGGIK